MRRRPPARARRSRLPREQSEPPCPREAGTSKKASPQLPPDVRLSFRPPNVRGMVKVSPYHTINPLPYRERTGAFSPFRHASFVPCLARGSPIAMAFSQSTGMSFDLSSRGRREQRERRLMRGGCSCTLALPIQSDVDSSPLAPRFDLPRVTAVFLLVSPHSLFEGPPPLARMTGCRLAGAHWPGAPLCSIQGIPSEPPTLHYCPLPLPLGRSGSNSKQQFCGPVKYCRLT